MPDAIFDDPRLAVLYDALDPDRSDLLPYLEFAREIEARRVLDVGCGTGVFAMMLAAQGIDVVALDPAEASIAVAGRKAGAERVRWIVGDASALDSGVCADLATMTANVFQVFPTPQVALETLRAVRAGLRSGGYLMVATRVPARKAWLEWGPQDSHSVTEISGVGPVEAWSEVTQVVLPLVSVRWWHRVPGGGALASDATLRFWERDEVAQLLQEAGFEVVRVDDAPDRPGREYVFVARASFEGAAS